MRLELDAAFEFRERATQSSVLSMTILKTLISILAIR